MQQVKAGLKAIYLSGWQVAADANIAGEMYPDQSLYPANSVPEVVRKINNTLLRADQLHHAEGDHSVDWLQPIVADAEAGFGGPLHAFELTNYCYRCHIKQLTDAYNEFRMVQHP
jgi:isocitrate lyase